MAITKLQQLSLDVYNGKEIKFNEVSGEQAIRNAFAEVIGEGGKEYRRNPAKFFELMEELLVLPMGDTVEGMFQGLVEEDSIGLADSKIYTIPDQNLFKVAKVASGNSDMRRQKIYDTTLQASFFNLQVKIYEELDKFRAGKINWAEYVNKVRASLKVKLAEEILNGFVASYSSLNATYGVTGAFSTAKLTELISNVKMKTGMNVAVYGTSGALGKIATAQISGEKDVLADSQKEAYASMRHFGNFGSTELIELPQVAKTGTGETPALDDSTLFILPVGEKLIKVCNQGDVYVDEDTTGSRRNDRQIEFLINMRTSVSIILSNYYSIYKLV